MTFCPGKKQSYAVSGTWDRDLDLDLARVREWGAVAVVTLMEAPELVEYRIERIGVAVEALGMEWHHLPITDVDIPREPFETLWVQSGPRLRAHLGAGRRIVLHCRGGLGRTGTIAARLLAELGVPAYDAIAAVRAARPGALETPDQRIPRAICPSYRPGCRTGRGRRLTSVSLCRRGRSAEESFRTLDDRCEMAALERNIQ